MCAIAWECFWLTSEVTRVFVGVTLVICAVILGTMVHYRKRNYPSRAFRLRYKINELWKRARKVPKGIGTKARSYFLDFRAKGRSYSLGTAKISNLPPIESESSGDGSTTVPCGLTLPHASRTGRGWTFSIRLRSPQHLMPLPKSQDTLVSSLSPRGILPLPVSSLPQR